MKQLLWTLSLGFAVSLIACSESTTSADNSNNHDELESFTDSRDNRSYKKVTIGDQTWMAENLYFQKYFYTWEEAKEACPEGWHLPNDNEWKILFEEVGGTRQAGLMLKSSSEWASGGNGKDEYGFAAAPMGYRDTLDERQKKGDRALFWSATELDSQNAYNWRFDGISDYVFYEDYPKDFKLSVRCIENKNSEEDSSSSSTKTSSSSISVQSSSSSAKTSSSSVQESSSSSKIASSSSSSKDDASSSSSTNTSSSSVQTSSSSSVNISSSSSVKASSSSSVKVSSSSINASSSSSVRVSSSSINATSSSNVKLSSSSIKASSSSSAIVSSSSSIPSSSSIVSSSSEQPRETIYDPINNTLTDGRDGQVYRTVTIGKQTWMAENLNYNYYYKSAQSFCYENDPANCEKYGRLYNWSALMDSAGIFSQDAYRCGSRRDCTRAKVIRGVCPEGWHVPSTLEWNNLFYTVGERSPKKLLAKEGWDGTAGTDDYGFTVLPAGVRNEFSPYYKDIEKITYLWTNNQNDNNVISYDYIGRYYVTYSSYDNFYSVRCLMNNDEETVIPKPDHEIIYGTIEDTRDGNVYKTVQIGDRTWMAENMRLEYNEGSAVSICPGSKPENCETFGRLYSWAAAMDSAGLHSSDAKGCGHKGTCEPSKYPFGICPDGWRLPSREDFQKLVEIAGGDGIAGRHLKSTSGWTDEDTGYDLYGFNAIPTPEQAYVAYWTSTIPSGSISSVYRFSMHAARIYSDISLGLVSSKNYYSAVRCIKMTQAEINSK